VVLQAIERRLERLVEGAFGRAFRSDVQPVELARRIVRELEAGRQLGVNAPVAPNEYRVRLSPDDKDRFDSFGDTLGRELTEAVRTHAREEGYQFVGPVTVALAADNGVRRGGVRVDAAIVEGEIARAAIVLPDGERVEVASNGVRIGRLPDCAVQISDPQSSRHHAEVRAAHGGFEIVDLGSTNGTYVNDTTIKVQALHDGDTIRIGSTAMRFEEC
jgi:hypothetical protein